MPTLDHSIPLSRHRSKRSIAPALVIATTGLALGLPSIAEACGALGERPCNIWEAFPSCDSGLAEDFLLNKCVSNNYTPPPAPPPCGAENTRPCYFWEQMPSCNVPLVEDFIDNRCEPPPASAYPPPHCGNLNQTPCTIGVAPTSCAPGLKETFASPNTCVPLAPGEWSPFFAGLEGLNDSFQALGEFATQQCRNAFSNAIQNGVALPFVSDLTGAGLSFPPAISDAQCVAHVAAGFACETPSLIEMFDLGVDHAILHDLQTRFNDAHESAECRGIIDPVERTACAAGMMVFETVLPGSAAAMACFSQAAQKPELWQTLTGDVNVQLSADTCMNIGTATFDLAMLVIESKAKFGKKGAPQQSTATYFKDQRTHKYGGTQVGSRLQTHNDTNRMPAIDAVAAALEVLGNADAVIGILAGIPECTDEPWDSSAVVGDGTFYRIDSNGDLQMSHHDSDGVFDMVVQTIGWGWAGMDKIFAAEGGSIYAIDQYGTLRYYQHDSTGNFYDWDGVDIGWGWGGFNQVWAGRVGEIYAIDEDGRLFLYKHDGNFSWENVSGQLIGTGWMGQAKIFGGGRGAIYVLEDNGDLLYYYHDGNNSWVHHSVLIGTGWDGFVDMGSTGNGEIYALTIDGKLLFYRHNVDLMWLEGSGGVIGTGWSFGSRGIIPAQY